MKKFILIIMLVIVSAVSFSCKKEAVPEYTISVEFYTLDDDSREVNIAYPLISGTKDDTHINSVLKEFSVDSMQNFMTYTNSEGFFRYTVDSLSADYIGEKLVSFLCTGSYSDEGSSHPETIVYTININPQTGKIYTFRELVSDFDLLAEKFNSGGFKLVSGADGLLDTTNYEDIFIEYSSLYGIYPQLYFIGGDKPELAFSVGLVYTLGGHAEFSISTDGVKNALTETLLELLN